MTAPSFRRVFTRASAAGLTAVTLMAWASAGRAATPAGPSPAADAAAEAKRQPPKSGAPQPGPPPCASGEPRDDTGACPVVDDAPATRGFELFSGTLPGPGAHAGPAAPVAESATAATDANLCGAMCDLKIGFKAGSAALTHPAETTLARFAQALDEPALAGKRFEIAGHTDASGSAPRNLALSQARADAVVAFLVAHGVPPTRLSAKGYGSDRLFLQKFPLDPRNRRVEARVVD